MGWASPGTCACRRPHALQCLEGLRCAVNTVYNLVAAPAPLRRDTAARKEAWRRLFPVWDMGFTSDLATAAPESARWHDDSGFNPYLVDSDLIENVISAMRKRRESGAACDFGVALAPDT